MREAEVQAAFIAVLRERGWDVTTEKADWTNVIARLGSDCIVAEVKGETSSAGTDVDTAYGQLLRRMTDRRDREVRRKRYITIRDSTDADGRHRGPKSPATSSKSSTDGAVPATSSNPARWGRSRLVSR